MVQITIPQYDPTVSDDFEDGYNIGFDDGFDMALLIEKDEDWITRICLEACNRVRTTKGVISNKELSKYIRDKYRKVMDLRKTGTSFIFDEGETI